MGYSTFKPYTALSILKTSRFCFALNHTVLTIMFCVLIAHNEIHLFLDTTLAFFLCRACCYILSFNQSKNTSTSFVVVLNIVLYRFISFQERKKMQIKCITLQWILSSVWVSAYLNILYCCSRKGSANHPRDKCTPKQENYYISIWTISNLKITLTLDSLEIFNTSTTNNNIDINLFLYLVAIISGEWWHQNVRNVRRWCLQWRGWKNVLFRNIVFEK